MNKRSIVPELITGLLVALAFGIALYLRVCLPHDRVFVDDWIKLTGTDPYYFMRHVENLLRHFPNQISFDPYLRFPTGMNIATIPFIYIIAGITWLIGLGSPSQHTIDLVGIYFPAVAAACSVIPVYFIGKVLFHRWAGVIAALLIAILPGDFLGSAILGFTDRNSLQVLLTCVSFLFFILAIKNGNRNTVSISRLIRGEWTIFGKTITYSILAGLSMGAYLIIWRGAFVFIFIIFVYLIIQSIYDYVRSRPIDYLVFTCFVVFLVTLIIYLPIATSTIYRSSLLIALITPVILYFIAWIKVPKKIMPYYYPLALLCIGLIIIGLLNLISPKIFRGILSLASTFVTGSTEQTILEMQPILSPGGTFTFRAVWYNFTTSSLLSIIALVFLIFRDIRRGEPDKLFLLIWSIAIIIATLLLRRFALLFTINAALLTGYLSWLGLRLAGLKDASQPITLAPIPQQHYKDKKAKKKQKPTRQSSGSGLLVKIVFVSLVIFFAVFFPNISPAQLNATSAFFTPPDAWYEALYWLRDNSPQPFGDPDFYYQLYQTPFKYPDTAYGVLSWWDYGYIIMRVAQRPSICDPGGSNRLTPARFFLSQNEASALKLIQRYKARYLIIDYAMVSGKFSSIATYANTQKEKYFDNFYHQQGNDLVPEMLFYPEYYRSIAVRLFNFDGIAAQATDPEVISYAEKSAPDGSNYKQITSREKFDSFEKAMAYINSTPDVNLKLVGTNPFISSVPLEILKSYSLVYSSKSTINQPGIGRISQVKVFEKIK